jgi:hypothetical protein
VVNVVWIFFAWFIVIFHEVAHCSKRSRWFCK